MSLLRRNIVANALGQGIGVISGILLMPLYARYLGTEGFGLVGFLLSLQAIAAILDLGLGAAVNRELSRLRVESPEPGYAREVVRTLEWVYFALASCAAGLLALASAWLATNWIQSSGLEPETVRQCLQISAATIGLRLMGSLYYGVLRGIERQVAMNLFASGMIAAQTVGLAAILILFRPAITTFFFCQFLFVLTEILAIRYMVWRECRIFGEQPPRFRMSVIREVWRYALSVNGISIFAAGIKQVDKVIVSKLLPIGNLGYYSAAALAANGLGKIAVPFQTALFPRFSKLHAQQRHEELGRLFRDCVRLLTLLNCAVAGAFVFFSHDILMLWMQSQEAADVAARPMAVLSAAMMLNGAMAPVFSLILATGYTRISLAMNAGGFIVLVPLTYWLVSRFGLVGAAAAWLLFNVAYYCIVPAWLARYWPRFSVAGFYLEDSLPFMFASLALFLVASWLLEGYSPWLRIGGAVIAGGACLAAGLAMSASLRAMARTTLGARA